MEDKYMKKVVYISLLFGALLLFIGCSNNSKDKIENSEMETDNIGQEDGAQDSVEKQLEEAANLCFKTCISDEKFIDNIEAFIIDENQFINKMETEWPSEGAEQVEYNDSSYLLVGEFSWVEYEKKAMKFYSEDYVKTVFTPEYKTNSNLFIELEGKLYRAMADGIGRGIKEDSTTVWQIAQGLYYVIVRVEYDQLDVCVYIVEENSDKECGFEIVNKYECYP